MENLLQRKKLNIPRKLARLYLVNDLLFNSNSFRPGKKYRKELKTKLEEICTNLQTLHSRLSGETQEDFRVTFFLVLHVRVYTSLINFLPPLKSLWSSEKKMF